VTALNTHTMAHHKIATANRSNAFSDILYSLGDCIENTINLKALGETKPPPALEK